MNVVKQLSLNVIVPTFNRASLLRHTLTSLANAEIAPALSVTISVADNNSTDETKRVVEEYASQFTQIKLEYLFEKQQGRSFALNTALRLSTADLVSFVDDDEEIAPDWYTEIAKLFGERWDEIDFAGGKVLPRWENAPPAWITQGWTGIGWRDFGDEEWVYDETTPILSGGHAIIKREIFDELGFYIESLGATGKNLLSCEDDVMYDKLLKAEKRGVYDPRLVILHYVPDYRLTASYFRQWCYGNGLSQQIIDVTYKSFDGARLLGVPRYMYREAFSSAMKSLKQRISGGSQAAFAREHGLWVFWGFFYGRNIKHTMLEKPLQFVADKLIPAATR